MFRLALPVVLALVAGIALAESVVDPHAGHQLTGEEAPSSKAFIEANAKMHANMAIAYTGNPDIDFVAGMIEHHKGAVDMAKVELVHGKDPQLLKLAEKIIAEQEAEIAWMQEWLAKQPK